MEKTIETRKKLEDLLFSAASTSEMIEILLQIIGINSSLAGYEYIKDGILKLLSLPNLVNVNLINEVYTPIAKKFNIKNWRKIERSIRYCIKLIFNNPNISEERLQIRKYIFINYNDDLKITNSEVLFTLTRFIKNINNVPR